MVNYFELYGLPLHFRPDQALVKRKFYELSRQFHPDRFTQAGAQAIEEAEKMSALINEAYKTLKDEDATIQYLLKLHSMLEDEEKYSLPPDFLMEMMELNEAVSDYEMNPESASREEAIHALKSHVDTLQQELWALAKRYEQGDHSKELWMEVKDCYFRRKYLLRIQERIAKFATP